MSAVIGGPRFVELCSTSPSLPVWLRLSFYALEHDGQPLKRGELRSAISPGDPVSGDQIYEGIQTAVQKGLLSARSTPRVLFTPEVAQ